MDDVIIGPQISHCTISSGVHSVYDLLTTKVSLCCFPKMHPSQTLSRLLINSNHFTKFSVWSSFIPPKFRCPNLKCHSEDSCWNSVWNASWKSALSFSFLSQYMTSSLLSALISAYVLSGTILNGNKWLLVISTLAINWLHGRISLITWWFIPCRLCNLSISSNPYSTNYVLDLLHGKHQTYTYAPPVWLKY